MILYIGPHVAAGVRLDSPTSCQSHFVLTLDKHHRPSNNLVSIDDQAEDEYPRPTSAMRVNDLKRVPQHSQTGGQIFRSSLTSKNLMLGSIALSVLLGRSNTMRWSRRGKESVTRHARKGLIAAFAVALIGMSALVDTPAQAAPAAPVPIPSNKCVNWDLCFYSAQGFGGSAYETRVTGSTCRKFVLGDDNTTTSIINRSGIEFYVYDASNCTGTPLGKIFAHTANDNIGPANNDRISSWKTTGPLPSLNSSKLDARLIPEFAG